MLLEVDDEDEGQSLSYRQVNPTRESFLQEVASFNPDARGGRQSDADGTTREQMLLHKKEDNHFPENMQLQFAFCRKSKPW